MKCVKKWVLWPFKPTQNAIVKTPSSTYTARGRNVKKVACKNNKKIGINNEPRVFRVTEMNKDILKVVQVQNLSFRL